MLPILSAHRAAVHGFLHRMSAHWVVRVALAALVFSWPVARPVGNVQAESTSTRYAGWAVEAYPEQSAAEMESIVRRLVQDGANVVWIGHNNPGEVDADKVEPGLSYAVYQAYQDLSDPRHEDAVAMIQAQRRMLEACHALGVKVVLPVGYQIQMGQRWNEEHPADLRRDVDGQPLNIFGGGVSASFYAPDYRRDIEVYYRWVDAEFVQPYADVLLMLNLADEPIGGDYSPYAGAEFRAQVGLGFEDVGDDMSRQRLLGQFQSRYVVEYAILSAGLWQEIHPGLPVTMSFDGAQARQTFTLPDLEALFRDTPANFAVTLDAYPRDGLPNVALSEGDLVGLFLLVRSAGFYSARYGKPLWLWAAANSWGLSQASPQPGTLSDAVANGLYLALLARQAGGDLQGIAYWNYNVKGQGLYNDTHATTYNPDTMFSRVSALLPTLRQLMALPPSRPEVLILAPPARAYEQIGAERTAIRLEVQPFRRLAMLARTGINAAVVGSLDGWPLDGVRAIVVLSPAEDYMAAGDVALLRTFVARGGKIVASPGVGKALAGVTGAMPELGSGGLVEQWGNLYMAQQGVAVLFEDQRADLLSGFWREVLGLEGPQPGYQIVTGQFAFYYNPGPGPVAIEADLPFEGLGCRYDESSQPVEWIHRTHLAIMLGRHEFVFLERAWPFRPWV
jgi:hypothetical protein